MSIPIITVTNQPVRAGRLVKSATKNNLEIYVINCDWNGFGTKVIELYNFLKERPDISEFIFADAHDVVVLDRPHGLDLITQDIVFNAEKNCWPVEELKSEYPKSETEWKYLNSGVFFAKRDAWMRIIEENPIEYHTDDQLYYTKIFLSGKYNIGIDDICVFFQCYSFISPDDFTYDGLGVINNKTGTYPSIFHGNGTTDMSLLEKYL